MKATALKERRLRKEAVSKVQSHEGTIRGLQNQMQYMQIGGYSGQQMNFNRCPAPIIFPTQPQMIATTSLIEMESIESVDIPDYLM